jgi:hypothetical protein
MTEFLDTKPYVEHDELIGYRYAANTRRMLAQPGGGQYEIVINSAGIRSAREYEKRKPAGVYRILVFGDSYAAGQYISNEHRFTETMERRIPDLEVINFALEGTGTDQQLLIYENIAAEYEHDLVMVFPFLQNIRRNLADARVAFDPCSGQKVLRGKPRFELQAGQLLLLNTPVPIAATDGPSSDAANDELPGFEQQWKSLISRFPAAQVLKKFLYAIKPWEPFPEYRSPDHAAWSLMEAMFTRFAKQVAPRPFVIVPVFYDSYVRFRMARNYWERFYSLAGPGVHVVDLLAHFRHLGRDAVRCFQAPFDCHFSSYGHLVIADWLIEELNARGLMANRS